jgi:hypothetical protein
MTRWPVFIPVAALTVFVAYLGLRLGEIPSETQIITQYAEGYVSVAGVGARLTDCAAAPHPSARMIILCHHNRGTTYRYIVGNRGQLIRNEGPSA